MPSEYSLRGTGWNASDWGGAPSPSEVTVSCDNCDEETTADDMEGWDATVDWETYERTTLCPDCSGAEGE